MKAYAGRILHINLTSGKSRTEELDERTAKMYLGGVGLGVNLLMEHSKPGKDAFDSDTPLIYCTGPLSGTLGFAGGGYVVVSKSPLTGGVCVGVVQGFFGSELRRAGYDAVVIKGKSDGLSYLWIDDDNIQVRDAQRFKGCSVRVVKQSICEELGDFCIRVSGVGEAGERLCRFAAIVGDKCFSVGRGGLGAVMGSKNLKAIAVRGTHDVNVANLEGFVQFVKNVYERVNVSEVNSVNGSFLSSKGLLALNSFSALAVRNWREMVFEDVEKINVEYLTDQYVKKMVGCASCGVNCMGVAVVSEGSFKDVMARFDFDCILSLGFLCGIDRFDVIVKAASLVNDYGLDCISVGAVVAFAMDLYEQGVLTFEQTEGVDLRFGNVDAFLEIINKIGKREGWLGNLLAEGVMRAAEVIGGEASKFACHIKGLELPGYDLRALKHVALDASVTFNGDRHFHNDAELLSLNNTFECCNIERDVGSKLFEINQRYNVLDSLILCRTLSNIYTWQDLTTYYTLATGLSVTAQELQQTGERIENLARLFNILEGRGTRSYDDLPYKLKNCPVSAKNSKKSLVISDDELQLGIDAYYVACGWTADGIPTVERLKQIGLGTLSYISEQAIATARAQEEK